MGLISFLQKAAQGRTEWQGQKRYARAASRVTTYMKVAQWHLENSDSSPGIAQDYEDMVARFRFRGPHQAVLVGQQADIARKLGHAKGMGIKNNAFLCVFTRPADDTVFCFFALLRDDSQNYAMAKPYWFLSSGEKEADFMSDVVDFMGGGNGG